jgi:hypothetical protein
LANSFLGIISLLTLLKTKESNSRNRNEYYIRSAKQTAISGIVITFFIIGSLVGIFVLHHKLLIKLNKKTNDTNNALLYPASSSTKSVQYQTTDQILIAGSTFNSKPPSLKKIKKKLNLKPSNIKSDSNSKDTTNKNSKDFDRISFLIDHNLFNTLMKDFQDYKINKN